MVEQHQHYWAVANLLIGRYGPEAAHYAEARAQDADRNGDTEALAIWRSVLSTLRNEPPDKIRGTAQATEI